MTDLTGPDFFGEPQHDTPRWNETMFFEAWSPDTGVGVFLHMGRYPTDLDLWWCQAITYLPDGRLTSDVHWGRNVEPGARTGAMSVEVLKPLEHWRLLYDGAGEATDNAAMLRGLSGAGVAVPVRWRLDARAAAPVWNLKPTPDGAMPDFAQSSHSQQTYRVTGTVTVSGVDYALDGVGCNDHSRGIRDLTHFAGDQWVVGVMPDYAFHVINVWKADQQPVLEIGAWFDAGGQHDVTATRHPGHQIDGTPRSFDLEIDHAGEARRLQLEVQHGCTISATQQGDNLNGVGWELPGDTVVLCESPIRIVDEGGAVGFGHLERAVRLDQVPAEIAYGLR